MGILPLLLTSFLTLQAHSAAEKAGMKPHTTMLSSFKTKSGTSCTASIEEAILPTDEPDAKLKIRCDNETILTHDFEDAGIQHLTTDYYGPGRIAVTWERGTGAGITIFQVTARSGKTTAKKVFDHFSKCGGEAFEGLDVVLAEVGRRFVGSEILPAGTNVYRWKDGKYVFTAGYLWNANTSWDDRYCVFTPSAICPAVTKSKPIPDSD